MQDGRKKMFQGDFREYSAPMYIYLHSRGMISAKDQSICPSLRYHTDEATTTICTVSQVSQSWGKVLIPKI